MFTFYAMSAGTPLGLRPCPVLSSSDRETRNRLAASKPDNMKTSLGADCGGRYRWRIGAVRRRKWEAGGWKGQLGMAGLINRLQTTDSVSQFEIAARQRFEEASLLYFGRRSYSAIYLYGYAVEMWLKAAYFHNEGIIAGLNDPLTQRDRDRAWKQRKASGAPNRYATQHDIEIWAYLLIYIRRTARIYPPYNPLVESTLQNYGATMRNHWSVEMRYQHLEAIQPAEIDAVRNIAEWFSSNYLSL
jgi:hypothetical protein